MWQRFPPRMRRALVAALDEAARQGRDVAEPEDLLVAIAHDKESAGAYLLEQCGVEVEQIVARRERGDSNGNGDAKLRRAHLLDESTLNVLRRAGDVATRLRHEHVGTEHVIAALSGTAYLEIGKKLNAAGLSPDTADAAIARWISDGMPRRRGGWGWKPIRPRALASALRPVQKALRIGPTLWKIFAGKSLAHPGYVSNPYPLYAWLRRREPVRMDPLAPVWILTRYDDVNEFLRNPRFLKDPFGPQRVPRLVRQQLGMSEDESRVEAEVVSMLFLDPPNHTRVRGVFARAFTPASLANLRPRIELIARKRVDRVAGGGRMDIIADLAYPLPVIVIAEMLGFPPEDYPRIKDWSDHLAAALSLRPTAEQQAKAAHTWSELRVYFDEVVSKTQKKPGDSLLPGLLEMEGAGDGINREELFTNCVLLLSAGHETTTNLIGNAMLSLLRNRDQWELLTRQPELIEAAVEEALRFDCPVQWTSRLPAEPMEIGGRTIPPGQIVLGCLGAANRDPDKFPDPDRFDIRRTENRHLAFGTGIHFCLGAAMARMEAQIAIRELVLRFPRMKLAGGRIKWLKGLTFRGVRSLPVVLE